LAAELMEELVEPDGSFLVEDFDLKENSLLFREQSRHTAIISEW